MRIRYYRNLEQIYSSKFFCILFLFWDKLILVIKMNKTQYEVIANRHKAVENKFSNSIISFFSGGLVGLLGEGIIEILCNYYSYARDDASTIMIVFFIFIGSFFTALGFFDNLVSIFKCGLLIPITGFAHSMTSSAMDYRKEGLIYGIGSNMFKLAGNVILYGIISAWFFGTIRYLIGGLT